MANYFPSPPDDDPPIKAELGPLVVLLHGIRTEATWQKRIAPLLAQDGRAVVCPIGYGFQNVFEFLLPGPTRNYAIKEILWRLDKAIEDYPDRNLVIVAHSFGTYCLSEILKQHPRIKPSRVLLCGSVVLRSFRWDLLKQRPVVVNECGTKDIWPPLARAMSWGYGASGTFGFKTPGICDRYHDGAHSDYFDENFVKKYWVNFVWNGDVEASHYEKGMTEYPWWASILASRLFWIPWLGWLLAALLLFLTWTLLPGPTGRNTGSTSKPITADLQAPVLAVEQEAQEARRNADDKYQRISTVLGNSESTLPQQIAALDELPDAMCVVVPRAVVSQTAPVGLKRVYSFPNLERLRTVLRLYMRFDRTAPILKKAGFAKFVTSEWNRDDEEEPPPHALPPLALQSLAALRDVSTTLLQTLHRLGPSGPDQQNLWQWSPPADGVPEAQLTQTPRPRDAPAQEKPDPIDLVFLPQDALTGICAPYADLHHHIRVRDGASLRRAQLQKCRFEFGEFPSADFFHAQLQGIDFGRAHMQGAQFSRAQLEGAFLVEAQLQRADFARAQMQFVDLVRAELLGADLSGTQMRLADVREGRLYGANLWHTGLQRADLSEAKLSGAHLMGTQLQGAELRGASFGAEETLVHAVLTPDHKDVVFQDSYRGGSSEVRILVPGALFQEVTIQPDDDAIFIEPPIASSEASWAWQRLSPYMTDPVVTSELTSLHRRLRGAERETVERMPWPIEGEAIYRKAFGEDRIKRRKSLLTLGGWRPHYFYVYHFASFAGPMGNAWLDSSAREQLLRCLNSDPKVPVLNEDATKLYAQIENDVMHPGKVTSDVEWAKAVAKWREWTIEKAVKEALMQTKP